MTERRYLKISLDEGTLKQAIYERNKDFFVAMLDRLSQAASTTPVSNWRCIRAYSNIDSPATCDLIFEGIPSSKPADRLACIIDKLLNSGVEE